MTEAEAKEKRRKRMSELMSGPLMRRIQADAEQVRHCRKIESKVKDETN